MPFQIKFAFPSIKSRFVATKQITPATIPPQPLEKLIKDTRQQYGELIVRSARLTQQDKTQVYIINFTNSKQQWIRTVYDARTGQLISSVSLKAPMPIEKSLAIIHEKHPGKNLLRSWLDSQCHYWRAAGRQNNTSDKNIRFSFKSKHVKKEKFFNLNNKKQNISRTNISRLHIF